MVALQTRAGCASSLTSIVDPGEKLTVDITSVGSFAMSLSRLPAIVADAPRRVMVVDDEPDLRDGLMALLRIKGYSVTGAGDGSEALRRIDRSAPPEVIILDLVMPVMSGSEMLAQLRKDPALRGIYVIVVSATDRPVSGADAFFQKPYTVSALLAKVQQLCLAHTSMAKLTARR